MRYKPNNEYASNTNPRAASSRAALKAVGRLPATVAGYQCEIGSCVFVMAPPRICHSNFAALAGIKIFQILKPNRHPAACAEPSPGRAGQKAEREPNWSTRWLV